MLTQLSTSNLHFCYKIHKHENNTVVKYCHKTVVRIASMLSVNKQTYLLQHLAVTQVSECQISWQALVLSEPAETTSTKKLAGKLFSVELRTLFYLCTTKAANNHTEPANQKNGNMTMGHTTAARRPSETVPLSFSMNPYDNIFESSMIKSMCYCAPSQRSFHKKKSISLAYLRPHPINLLHFSWTMKVVQVSCMCLFLHKNMATKTKYYWR